jgi:hypothetical protein
MDVISGLGFSGYEALRHTSLRLGLVITKEPGKGVPERRVGGAQDDGRTPIDRARSVGDLERCCLSD